MTGAPFTAIDPDRARDLLINYHDVKGEATIARTGMRDFEQRLRVAEDRLQRIVEELREMGFAL